MGGQGQDRFKAVEVICADDFCADGKQCCAGEGQGGLSYRRFLRLCLY